MVEILVPIEAINYLKNKKVSQSFSYKDVWAAEHANAFVVAKMMKLEMINATRNILTKAIKSGESRKETMKKMSTYLQSQGWWGKKEVYDPKSGKMVLSQLGSDRRLKVIYATNMRSAYVTAQVQRAMRSDYLTHFIYSVGNSVNHRKEHLAWDGVCLPKDDPFWKVATPPNGYGCKCRIRAISTKAKNRYLEEGVPDPESIAKGRPTKNKAITTTPPKLKYKEFLNDRTGDIDSVPMGITPSFDWSPAFHGNSPVLARLASDKVKYMLKTYPEKSKVKLEGFLNSLTTEKIPMLQWRHLVEEVSKGNSRLNQTVQNIGFVPFDVIDKYEELTGMRPRHTNIEFLVNRITKGKGKHLDVGKLGNGLELDELLNLPNHLANPHAIYLDLEESGDGKDLVYTFEVADKDRLAKVVVRLDKKGNHITTAFQVTKENITKNKRYVKLR